MIVALDGLVVLKEPTKIHLNVNDVVYEIFISLNVNVNIGDKTYINITQIFRDEGIFLYGFLDIDEKTLFDRLIKINGVGPKVALAICSTYTPKSFLDIINSNDITSLKRVPGIGAKGASRILVELSGFSISLVDNSTPNSKREFEKTALMALESLGFKKDLIEKTLKTCVSSNSEDLVKEALKKIGR